jgi:maltose alpha-D-glucosyltransferase/alpha-amylase
MFGQTQLPKIGEQPYVLTLAPYGFYWFQLQEAVVPPASRILPIADEHPAVPSLFAGVVWDATLDGSMRGIIEKQALLPFLQRQRWFGGKARPAASARFVDWATLRRGAHPAFLSLVEVQYRDGGRENYVLPLAMVSGADADAVEQQHGAAIVARISGARKGLLFDGLHDDGLCQTLLGTLQQAGGIPMKHGRVQGTVEAAFQPDVDGSPDIPIRRTPHEQSNTAVLFGWQLVMKMFRRLEPGENPDVEIGRFLTARGFRGVPTLLASLTYQQPDRAEGSIVMLQRFVTNQGNAWDVTVEEVGRYFDRVQAMPDIAPGIEAEVVGSYLSTAEILGRRTGELHTILASAAEPDFAPEPLTGADLKTTARHMRAEAIDALRLLETALTRFDGRRRELAREVLAQRKELLQHVGALSGLRSGGARIRCHGDYHLGQVLIAEADVVILDFEGEPARPLGDRQQKGSPLRDVAGMLRSFSYAALTGLVIATRTRPEDMEKLVPWARLWETWVANTFLHAYRVTTAGTGLLPDGDDQFDALIRAFMVDRALYELAYELNNRPDWVHIPLRGLLHLRSLDPA